jgi:NitT/TauT family transport system permease protein
VSRTSWLAIRAPLAPRRATLAKVAAFLLPLALWALVCFLWVPDVIITAQGDGRFNPGDRVELAKFEAENERLQSKPPQFRLTDKSLQAMRAAGVPEPVLQKVEPTKGLVYDTRKEFFDATDLDEGEQAKYGDKVWANLEKESWAPAVGEPSNPIWLPPPHKVALAFYQAFVTEPVQGDPWLHQHLWHSCQVIFWGFFLSAVVGIPLGILCGTFDLFSKLTEPFIDFIRYMPAPAFGVLCMAIFDIGDGPKIAIIWIGTFFQMVLVVANTTRQFDESLLEAAQTLGATKRSLLTKVILPGILPALYNDMRILLGWAWTYLIVAELIGESYGISYFITKQGRYRHFENVYAGIIMIGLIGLTCDQLLAGLARFLFPWQPRSEGSGAWAAFFGALTFLPRWVLSRISPATTSAPAPTSK